MFFILIGLLAYNCLSIFNFRSFSVPSATRNVIRERKRKHVQNGKQTMKIEGRKFEKHGIQGNATAERM